MLQFSNTNRIKILFYTLNVTESTALKIPSLIIIVESILDHLSLYIHFLTNLKQNWITEYFLVDKWKTIATVNTLETELNRLSNFPHDRKKSDEFFPRYIFDIAVSFTTSRYHVMFQRVNISLQVYITENRIPKHGNCRFHPHPNWMYVNRFHNVYFPFALTLLTDNGKSSFTRNHRSYYPSYAHHCNTQPPFLSFQRCEEWSRGWWSGCSWLRKLAAETSSPETETERRSRSRRTGWRESPRRRKTSTVGIGVAAHASEKRTRMEKSRERERAGNEANRSMICSANSSLSRSLSNPAIELH